MVSNAGSEGSRLRVAVVGGHPGDPEAGCGGTIAKYADQGHKVTVLYLTRGEAGVARKGAGAVRGYSDRRGAGGLPNPQGKAAVR